MSALTRQHTYRTTWFSLVVVHLINAGLYGSLARAEGAWAFTGLGHNVWPDARQVEPQRHVGQNHFLFYAPVSLFKLLKHLY